ncbi:MAG: uroporphyrinogen-III C-methyltransferase [Firmicutes bacterium]|nr:uroporphyrinogen-III C-methyltransferase [Bacillota bacterium]
MPGIVYLVGAGPGDPELITVKGLRCLQAADVVVYDRLVAPGLLEWARSDAERIYVGKSRGVKAMPQEAINRLLVERARQGKVVCRLKGGDPFVYGRGGEEAMALQAAGIPFVVVPGVTAAVAAPAAAGIPVTHRKVSASVAVVSGHDTSPTADVPWAVLARMGTVVCLMPLSQLEGLAERLLEAGFGPDTPAVAIERATLPEQRVVEAPLGELAAAVRRAGLEPPTTVVVGEVVRLRRWIAGERTGPLTERPASYQVP